MPVWLGPDPGLAAVMMGRWKSQAHSLAALLGGASLWNGEIMETRCAANAWDTLQSAWELLSARGRAPYHCRATVQVLIPHYACTHQILWVMVAVCLIILHLCIWKPVISFNCRRFLPMIETILWSSFLKQTVGWKSLFCMNNVHLSVSIVFINMSLSLRMCNCMYVRVEKF